MELRLWVGGVGEDGLCWGEDGLWWGEGGLCWGEGCALEVRAECLKCELQTGGESVSEVTPDTILSHRLNPTEN